MSRKIMPKKVFLKEDMKNKISLERIEECANLVEEFRKLINVRLVKEIIEPQFFIVRSATTESFFGNNVFRYDAYWCMPYKDITATVDIYKHAFLENPICLDNLLFFKLSIRETEKQEYIRVQSFELFLKDEKETLTIDSTEVFSDVLKYKNIQRCLDIVSVKQTRIEEFWEDFDIRA